MRFEVRGLGAVVEARRLFEGVSFALEPGERIVVRGASGSGKTRLLRLLSGLDPMPEGQVELDGRGLESWGPSRWRSEVVWVAQRPAGMSGTPDDFLAMVEGLAAQRGRPADDPRALAERWHLPRKIWGQAWSDLSGGERQRVSLAVAMSRRPAVLLLDEPTAALDPAATAAVEADLCGRTAVWVTHDETQAHRVGGRILSLDP